MCMETYIWTYTCVFCMLNVNLKPFPQPGSGVKVLKAMLQSGRTKTGWASSSCTLLGRVTISRAVWLLIVCTDKQAARDLWSGSLSPPSTIVYKRLFCKNALPSFCWLALTNVALIFDFKPAFTWSWICVYFKQVSAPLVFFYFILFF